jgi:hypothetical protein
MYLPDVESFEGQGAHSAAMLRMKASGLPVPQIWHLFEFKPEATEHLRRFTHEVMRGPSPLSAGERELIAAFTSTRNQCVF